MRKPDPALLTMGDITKQTGIDPRTLRFWIDSFVLEPEPGSLHAGRGVHRRFAFVELQIAALVMPLAHNGVGVGFLKKVAWRFRRTLTGRASPKEPLGGGFILDNVEMRRVMDRAARGEELPHLDCLCRWSRPHRGGY